MSWMDSRSRPSKHQATPPPLYLVPGGESTPYCKSCGRVISTRKPPAASTSTTLVKYCSKKCRSRKPGRLDRQIEDTFVSLLNDSHDVVPTHQMGTAILSKKGSAKKLKSDSRILVSCSTVETLIFGHKEDRARREASDVAEWKSVDMVDEAYAYPESPWSASEHAVDGNVLSQMSIRSGMRVTPPQSISEVNGGIKNGMVKKIEETEEMLEKRREGQRKANEREMVRCAARRGVAFGFVIDDKIIEVEGKRKKCEAVIFGKVVEPSFAKGDWSIRWRK